MSSFRLDNDGNNIDVEADFGENSISFHGKDDLIQLDGISYLEAKRLSDLFGDMADALKKEGR